MAILLTFLSVSVWGQILKVTDGNYYKVSNPKGVDAVFLFDGLSNAQFETQDNMGGNWMELPSEKVLAAGYNTFINVENAKSYRLIQNTDTFDFAVFDYSLYRLNKDTLTAQLSCKQTKLTLTAAPMQYFDATGMKHVLERNFRIQHRNLIWDNDAWKEELMEDTLSVEDPADIVLGKQLCNTDFIIFGDRFAEKLYSQMDSVGTPTYDAVAIDHHATTYTTTRGEKRENEAERPIEETTLKGSAPLNVLFRSHATPATDYYQWIIKHYDDVLVTRTESEQRYIFEEKGAYSAHLTISNAYGCECDTLIEDIAVSESMLRVPNVFTPNGDGANDEFRVAYRSLKEFHCWVYNRWGHLVFQWSDPAKGWDGTINGRPAPEGAYYYVIRALGTDAEDNSYVSKARYGKTIKKKPESLIGVYQLAGDINLLRGKK